MPVPGAAVPVHGFPCGRRLSGLRHGRKSAAVCFSTEDRTGDPRAVHLECRLASLRLGVCSTRRRATLR